MSMSTQTLAEAARLMEAAVMLDSLEIYDVGEPVTVGFEVTRALTLVTPQPVAGVVQSVSIENANEGTVTQVFTVKVPAQTEIKEGQAVKVVACLAEPDLVGKVLLLDSVSHNGLAMLRKAFASDFQKVNQEGKGEL